MEPLFLHLADVLESHRYQIVTYGGRPGIHDIGLLQSAISQPRAMFDGKFFAQRPLRNGRGLSVSYRAKPSVR